MEAQIAGIVALYIVVELVKWFAPRSSLTTEEHEYLKDLYDMHNHTDDSGRPLWYFPVESIRQNEKIIEALQKITEVQNASMYIAKDVIKMLDRIEIRVNGKAKA